MGERPLPGRLGQLVAAGRLAEQVDDRDGQLGRVVGRHQHAGVTQRLGRRPDVHPDHRAAGEAAFAAVYPDARNPYAHRSLLTDEGLEPWAVPELWLTDCPFPLRNHAVDVTDAFEKKMAALRAHESQDGASAAGVTDRIRAYLADTARRFGLAEGRLAEAFQVVHVGG